MRLAVAVAVGLAMAGCAAALPMQPGVTVTANPAPPHAYWAPPGSTIENHSTQDGIWIARGPDGQALEYYFGDACGAAERQNWIGMHVSQLPDLVFDGPYRIIQPDMAVTSDLIFGRLNVQLDHESRVSDVSCS